MRNPLKLWGSYAGLAAGLAGAYFSFAIVLHLAETGRFGPAALLMPAAAAMLGFLLGWALHASFTRGT